MGFRLLLRYNMQVGGTKMIHLLKKLYDERVKVTERKIFGNFNARIEHEHYTEVTLSRLQCMNKTRTYLFV